MTPIQLQLCTGSPWLSLAAKYCDPLGAAMREFEVDTPVRQAAFLAQVGHESGGLQFFHELWGTIPTAQQRRYERDYKQPWPASPVEAREDAFQVNRLAYTLGNDAPGDGFRYRGRGPIQITGKRNYGTIGVVLGDQDLVGHPELLDDPVTACRSAGAFWKWRGCNLYADSGDFIGLTKAINGGTTGLTDRQIRWEAAKKELGVT